MLSAIGTPTRKFNIYLRKQQKKHHFINNTPPIYKPTFTGLNQ